MTNKKLKYKNICSIISTHIKKRLTTNMLKQICKLERFTCRKNVTENQLHDIIVNKRTVTVRGSATIQKSNNWKHSKEQWNHEKFVMWCLGSNHQSKFYQTTFPAVFHLQWNFLIRNSKKTGKLFDIIRISSSVQNLACIKFGD